MICGLVIIHDNLPQLGDYMRDKIDAWFLDGFAPSKNPDMWNDALYTQMYRYTKAQGTFATFTAASGGTQRLRKLPVSAWQKRKGYGKKTGVFGGRKNT